MARNPAGRWKLIEVPIKAPGNCFTCKGIKHSPFIDTGLQHEYYREKPDRSRDGNVYICKACVEGMYHTLIDGDPEVDKRIEDARLAGVQEGIEKTTEKFNAGFIAISSSLADISLTSVAGDDLFSAAGNPEDDDPAGAADNEPAETLKQDGGTSSGEGADGISGNGVNERLTSVPDFDF